MYKGKTNLHPTKTISSNREQSLRKDCALAAGMEALRSSPTKEGATADSLARVRLAGAVWQRGCPNLIFLATVVKDGSGNVLGRVDYIGAIEYYGTQEINKPLITQINQVMTDEGRAYKQNGEYFYEYFIRDHQMNTRVAFGNLPFRKVYSATMEVDRQYEEEQHFTINPATRLAATNHTPLGDRSAALNATQGRMVGPAMVLNVKSGDYVEMEAWAKYTEGNWSTDAVANVVATMASAFNVLPTGTTEGLYIELMNAFNAPAVNNLFGGNEYTTEPAAYLQYLFFDADSIFQQAGFVGVSITAYNNWEKLEIDGGFTAPMDGFLYVYVANESASDKEVFFDDIKILHESSVATFKVSQINDYYPFGMLTGNSWRNDAYIDPGMLYQSLFTKYDSISGLYNYLLRDYDPALGRWLQMDPYNEFASPYLGMGNLPNVLIDPNGGAVFLGFILKIIADVIAAYAPQIAAALAASYVAYEAGGEILANSASDGLSGSGIGSSGGGGYAIENGINYSTGSLGNSGGYNVSRAMPNPQRLGLDYITNSSNSFFDGFKGYFSNLAQVPEMSEVAKSTLLNTYTMGMYGQIMDASAIGGGLSTFVQQAPTYTDQQWFETAGRGTGIGLTMIIFRRVGAKVVMPRAPSAIATNNNVKLLGQPINITQKGLTHTMRRHTVNDIGKYATKSKFSNPHEVSTLIKQSTHHPMIPQAHGNFARIVDAGKNIGIDRVTGQPTSIYTVITGPNGNLITAFPGNP
jgi:RHS repeat-associated protein